MQIEVRLFATLADLMPDGRGGVPQAVDIPKGATVATLLAKLAIPREAAHLVIVNGRPIHDPETILRLGDRVSLFPPVGGG